MRILLTAGPTREAIDPVRYIGNRSSGRMGAALAEAALSMGHAVTAIVGPVSVAFPEVRRIDVESAAQMHWAVMEEWPGHDLLIMAAAVADYRPKVVAKEKLSRSAGPLTLELEPTEDIAKSACAIRKPHQRVIGFSLENEGNLERARGKMLTKGLDLIVYNPTKTVESPNVAAVLIYPDGRTEPADYRSKADFADLLIGRACALW